MKYILIVFTLLLSLGCAPIDDMPKVETVVETVVETIVVTETIIETVEDTEKIEKLEDEIGKYEILLGSLNELLGYIYFVKQEKSDGSSSWGTGFSIEYKGNFYLITAGHIVENDVGYFPDLGFKKDKWIYPELLVYDNNYLGRKDYAIFTGDGNGFKVDLDDDKPLLLINETVTEYTRITIIGESGSPVIDIDGEVTEIATTDSFYYNSNIDIILEAIDNLK